jgi:hypothetical protein
MAENGTESSGTRRAAQSSRVLVYLGIAATTFTAILAARMVWEETSLTLQWGPQMLGFSLAHGAGAILFLAPILLSLWIFAAFIVLAVCLLRKRSLARGYWLTLGVAVAMIGILSIPPVFFQWLLMGSFAKSPHAGDLMVYDAREGDLRTVRGYLNHGVPLMAADYEGSTAVFAAASGGSLSVIEMLDSKGADLNATNLYGDSPLEAAAERGHASVVSFLRARGAVQIHGAPEQRDAASELIVRREIERENAR